MAALILNSIRLCTVALAASLALAAPALAGDVSVKLDSGNGFSIKNSTGAIERLRVDEATGNISRNGALFVHTTGLPWHPSNLFVGLNAGNTSSTFGGNTGVGAYALQSHTYGTANAAFGSFALAANTEGSNNAAFGVNALRSNTTSFGNSAFGHSALHANTTGIRNSAVGYHALSGNTTGSVNSALGADALRFNTTGHRNVAVGYRALYGNGLGDGNVAIGYSALSYNTTGHRNLALGSDAGRNQGTGSDNIYLANAGLGVESGQIKIGTVGTHTKAHVAGIHGATSSGGIAVLVNASGTLGTTSSSARFKQDVRDMADASDVLMKLRPVTFRYREDAVGAEEAKTTQYGLIAEQVAEVAPELVALDGDGKPYSVKYHELPALLLNEMQEQQRTIEKQAVTIEAQRQEYEKEIAALTSRLARLEAHAR